MAISAEDQIIHYLKDKVGLAEADRLIAALKVQYTQEALDRAADTITDEAWPHERDERENQMLYDLAEKVRKLGLPAEEVPEVPDAELHAAMRHPDFEYRTTEGPRKQWDQVDVPPADDNGDPDPTWERNTDAGRDGWERFDYTEESYWRRRKTEK